MDHYVHRVVVGPGDIDGLGHANNVSYLRWVQDAAEAHWDVLAKAAPAPVVQAIVWVVRRHEVEYLQQAFPDDRLEVITWVPGCSSTTCDRATVIRRGATVVTQSLSTYCVLDARTGRIRRITDELRALFGGVPLQSRVRSAREFPPLPASVAQPVL